MILVNLIIIKPPSIINKSSSTYSVVTYQSNIKIIRRLIIIKTTAYVEKYELMGLAQHLVLPIVSD